MGKRFLNLILKKPAKQNLTQLDFILKIETLKWTLESEYCRVLWMRVCESGSRLGNQLTRGCFLTFVGVAAGAVGGVGHGAVSVGEEDGRFLVCRTVSRGNKERINRGQWSDNGSLFNLELFYFSSRKSSRGDSQG